MRKISFLSALLVVLVSCNQVNTNGEKTITQGGDTVSNVEISVSKTDALTNLIEESEKAEASKLLFKAHGMEPGWFAEFYNNKLRLLVDYGKDSVLIDDKFENLDSESGFSYSKESLVISVTNKPCADAATGNTEDRTVLIKYKNTIYKGCGSFLK